MKKLFSFILLLILPFISHSQTFFVHTNCSRCDVLIVKKLDKLGYLSTTDSTSAIYSIGGVFNKDRNYMSFRTRAQKEGHLIILNKNNVLIDSTRGQKGSAGAINGFDADVDITRKILKSDFYAVIKNLNRK